MRSKFLACIMQPEGTTAKLIVGIKPKEAHMVRVFTGAFAAAMLGAVTMVGAQQPAAPQKPAEQAERDAKTTTITGCVKPGTAANSFVIEEISASAAKAPAEPGARPAGTSGVSKSYALMAKPGEDLSKHVNHKIEVTGTVSPAAPSAAPSPASSSQPKETLNVQSIKMVAATCQ